MWQAVDKPATYSYTKVMDNNNDRFIIECGDGVSIVLAPLDQRQIGRLAVPSENDPKEPEPPDTYTREAALEHLEDFKEAMFQYQRQRVAMLAMRELGLSWLIAQERHLSNGSEPLLERMMRRHGIKYAGDWDDPLTIGNALWELLADLDKIDQIFKAQQWQHAIAGLIPQEQVQEVLKSLRPAGEREADTGTDRPDQPEKAQEGRTADSVKPGVRGRRRGTRMESDAN